MTAVDNRRDFEPRWPVCREVRADGFCRGVQVGDTGYCVRHLDSDARTRHLAGLAPGADLDLRGVEVDPALLAEVLGPFRDHDRGRFVFGLVRCEFTWFTGRSWFHEADAGEARFDDAVFSGQARFDGFTCADRMSFLEARFDGEAVMGLVTARRLDLERASFAEPVDLVTDAEMVRCGGTRFAGGVTVRAPSATLVNASGTYFGAPSTIAGAKVVSLARTDVGNLVLTETDLSECEVLGAHRLDQLRIDGRTWFAKPGWGARRRMLFEEGRESPARVAAAYRALRKSFEDSKNEAGAGDFYYGEMECRRHSKESPASERVILWCYWLLSGYGQRASRALAALLVVVTVVTGLLTLWGQDFGLAARTALGAVVFRDDRLELTAAGEWTVLVARFLGPVLLALAVLAVRARVKR